MALNVTASGIDFTPQGGSSVNLLDDYEEGTWTPTNNNGTGLTNGLGKYSKVGRLVYWFLRGAPANSQHSTGSANVQGMPFQPGAHYGANFSYVGNANVQNMLPIHNSSTDGIYFHQSDGEQATVTNAQWDDVPDVIMSGFYHI